MIRQKSEPQAVKLFEAANELAYNDKLEEGLESLKKAVAIDNEYEDAYLSMAGIYVELKKYQEAYQNFKKRDRLTVFILKISVSGIRSPWQAWEDSEKHLMPQTILPVFRI